MSARRVHVGPIAVRMREADRRECRALGYEPKAALRRSLNGAGMAVTALIDGRPEAMMGVEVVSAVEGLGSPWMLATDVAYRHGRDLVRLGPSLIRSLADSMIRLSNVVSADNRRAIIMLRRWGFTVGQEVQVIGGVEFLTFEMIV